MKTNSIAPRQIFFFLACVAPAGKLVLLPARLAEAAGNNLLFPALFHLVLSAAAVFCVLLLAKRRESFYALLQGTFGSAAAKILCSLFALFLLFASFLPLLEQKLFVQSVFYDTLPSVVSFAPFFLFLAYLCSKPLSSFGRVWDILGPLAVAAFAGILILSAPSADYAALLPAGAAGGNGFLQGARAGASWFFDAALLIPMLGKIDYRKGTAWKGAACYLAGGAGVLFFLATFYGIFEGIATNQLFAFSATSKYFSGITVLGRIDYIFIYALALVMAFSCALPVQCAAECLLQACGRKKYLPTLLGVGASALLFALSLLCDYKFADVLAAVSGLLYWLFPLFCLLVPALMLLFLLKGGRRETA